MSEYCFFTPDSQALAESANLKDALERYAEEHKKQIYVLSHPLSKDDLTYDYQNAFVIFSSGRKPCFVDVGNDASAFEEFTEEFIDDIGYLSEKFDYRKKIGRKKLWSGFFEEVTSDELDLNSLEIDNPRDKRIVDLLTSLVIGSINDVSKLNLEANSLLDSVKSKIVLFDTDQTGFVFKMGSGKKYVIQGLAGSGKTELLLHKLKEVYSSELSAKIAFTCFNKILASSMKNRIPEFFNFMKVDRQIEWEDKLFCFHSWGSGKAPYSGMYRYICHKYNISFGSLSSGSFEQLCKNAIKDIQSSTESESFEYAFDYVFIDESQDFGDSFIELCELVTSKKVFVAGDVFQNIFRTIEDSVSHADLVLKKCYRTDPKNLMFSHALGMGLYEQPVLRWLKDHEWGACGYDYIETSNRAIVKRDPLRRFEDIPDQFESTTIHRIAEAQTISNSIFDVVQQIRERHETVQPGDIAVLFLDRGKYIYNVMPELANKVRHNLGWDVNISHESKTSDSSKFFISNINNAKGLEFPFVICFAHDLKATSSFRNGLYTMMARSFLESHLVLGNLVDEELVTNLNSGLAFLNANGYMDLRIPSETEIENQKAMIVWDEEPSLEDKVVALCEERGASPRLKAKLIQRMAEVMGEVEFDDDYFKTVLNAEYGRFEKL